jgi:hypothetical protein
MSHESCPRCQHSTHDNLPCLFDGCRCTFPRRAWVEDTSPKFTVGQKVVKPRGYRFDAEVVSVFQTTGGKTRIVAENGEGLLHIFNEEQLEPAPTLKSGSLYDDLAELTQEEFVALLRREGDDWAKNVGGMPLFYAAADRLDALKGPSTAERWKALAQAVVTGDTEALHKRVESFAEEMARRSDDAAEAKFGGRPNGTTRSS